MRLAHGALLIGIVAATFASAASASDGLGLTANADTPPWARWQGRISYGHTTPAWRASLGGHETTGLKPASVSVMGDYYFTDSLLGGGGGFRATSGLIVGLRSTSSTRARSGDSPAENSSSATATVTSPYLGLGYTGLASRGSLRYSADLGLLAQTPADGTVRLGRSAAGSIDDLLRDVRLGPVLQLGVSYSF